MGLRDPKMDDDVLDAVGPRLRALRRDRGITLAGRDNRANGVEAERRGGTAPVAGNTSPRGQ